jgi:uncharacterized protein (TIGR00661 family)
MRVIYGICSWGLGHATRSLPVIRELLEENNDLTVISHGRSLELLKKELGSNIDYYDIPDYPMLLSAEPRQFMAKSIIYWPLFIRSIQSGISNVKKIIDKKKFDVIISDARYDMLNKTVRTFFISHQIRIMNPLRIKILETGSELFNDFFFKRFNGIIVPDYKEDNLSGDLSHNLKKINEKKIHYVGVLSDFKKKKIKKDIDYLISITGPEPQRTILEKKLLLQANDLVGNIAITLGKTEEKEYSTQENIEIFSFLTKEERENLLNRSKLVISRSGYSTILDLAVIGAKALMTPTPGQIEQEYLSRYHNSKGTFYSVNQDKINLAEDIKKVKKTTGVTRKCDVDKSVENIMNLITS